MKKTLCLLALVATLMMGLSMTAMGADYTISSPEALLDFAKDITDASGTYDTTGDTWTLTTNIDMRLLAEDNAYWPGIGSALNAFKGTFNGAGHTITLWTNNDDDVEFALFSYIESPAVIKNVIVDGGIYSDGDIGGIVTYADGGSIIDCTNNASVSSSDPDASVGGVVASGSATVTNCSSSSGAATGDSFGITIVTDWFDVDDSDQPYTGLAIEPTVSSATLTKDDDYTVTYEDNIDAGTATITIEGIGSYTGELEYSFVITAKALVATDFTVDESEQAYTGLAIEPSVSSASLTEGADYDYTVAYTNNIEEGTATITITGVNNYTDTLEYTFTIAVDVSGQVPSTTELVLGENQVATGIGYTFPDDGSATGFTIDDSGIVYSPGITFYVPADTTLTITAIGGAV